MAAPAKIKYSGTRPISFLLDNQAGGATAQPTFLALVIRPEDLTRTDQSRLSVQQSMGGAWADNFGPGVPTITLSGHTGWKSVEEGNADTGPERFRKLKETVFDEWHAQRKRAIQSGDDPSKVRLIFTDGLDDFSLVVATATFSLRRSHSRPLVAQYSITMTGLSEDLQFCAASQYGYDPTLAGNAAAQKKNLLQSLTDSVNTITGQINNVRGWVQSNISAPVQGFMNQTAQLYGSVRGAIAAGTGLSGDIIGVAQMSAQAGVNLFRTLAAVEAIPQIAKAQLMAIGSAYSNIFCVLRNAAKDKFYEDYTDLYGASNCSSTVGGRPASTLAGVNPFYKVVPTSGPMPVTLTPGAGSALSTIASSDPVLSPMSNSAIASNLYAVNGGLAVSA